MDLHHAEALAKGGETASTFFPHGSVITTSTIYDSRLQEYTPDRELEVLTSFKPSFHIPCDRPVYTTQNSIQRRYFIESLQRSTIFVRDALRGTGISLIPLVKGLTQEEWLLCYEPLASEGFRGFAYYTAQYFGRGRGCRTRQLVEDVTGILSCLRNRTPYARWPPVTVSHLRTTTGCSSVRGAEVAESLRPWSSGRVNRASDLSRLGGDHSEGRASSPGRFARNLLHRLCPRGTVSGNQGGGSRLRTVPFGGCSGSSAGAC